MQVEGNKNTQSNCILLVSNLGKLGRATLVSTAHDSVHYFSVRQSLCKIRTPWENNRVWFLIVSLSFSLLSVKLEKSMHLCSLVR